MKHWCYILCISVLSGFFFSSCANRELKAYRIGVSQCSDDEWRHKMNTEMLREALFYDGLEVEIRSAKDNNQNQIADIQYFVENQVDLLIVAPNEAAAITPAVEKAFETGIPVIMVDRKIQSDKYTAFIGADNYKIGQDAGNYVINHIGPSGKILEIIGLEGSTPARERHEGFLNIIKNHPKIKVVASVDGEWLQDAAMEVMDSILNITRDIDFVFAQNDRMAMGAYMAAKKHQCEKEMKFVGVDALPGENYGLDLVMRDILNASFIYPTDGDKVIRLAMDILEKRPYDKDNELSSALVDKKNARMIRIQMDHISEQDGRIEHLNGQIDDFWQRYSVQTVFLYTSLFLLLLLAVLLGFIFRMYWVKHQMNEKLSKQKLQLEEQRDQLISLSKQLEEATHAKLVFFTNVSHDFRTPLTLVADPIEQLLADSSLKDKQHSLLKIAHKNVSILLRLVNQILDFRKYENGKLDLSLSTIDLCEQLQEWSQGFQTLAYKKHVHFNVNIERDTDFIMQLDAEKMERIYFNLLSNAFKHTPENGVINVVLSLVQRPKGVSMLLIISDTGKGISTEHIQHIFDRFYKIDINHSSGSGIGLALVKAFVELHGGSIVVESMVGRGTVFTVEIPVRKPEGEEIKLQKGAYITPQTILEELSDVEEELVEQNENKESILIIDDNKDIREYIKSMLVDKYIVIEAENGSVGLRKAMKYVPSVILCDVLMPEMDGLECCKRIKSEIQTSHIPVMLLTACALDEQRIEGFECGADSYVSKPFNSQLLLTRIKNLISNRQRLKQVMGDSYTLSKESINDMEKDFIDRFRSLIENNLGNSELSVEELGEQMGLSRVQLYRKIKALTNYSPVELLRITRLKKASALLSTTDKTISEITYEVGFTSPSYFTKCYKEYFGESPSDFLKRKNS